MEETKPLINQTNSEIQKEKTIQDKPEINEILIENNIDQFEKPEEPKAIPQEPIKEESPIKEEIPIESNSQPQMNNDQKDINLIAINNPNIDPNININNNISNTNLTLITNTDPGYIASQSNNEISSITPSKS